ncbi:hypothetical protein SLEP1_g20873 [Rubroshorea leprosula]|uniref:PORR domain-containing protein n=1 Tax=Rubroshorea leprosula TaxID=152421 RepID=A0AAV5JDE0_9ROSI|nr:hypothetical protein SLEP1_g20873 [Rubroshorea leprosula]
MVSRFIARHPLLFTIYHYLDGKMWVGLLGKERLIMDAMEADRVTKVRKLLMMSKDKRIPLREEGIQDLGLEEGDMRRLNLLNTLPLISPYSNGLRLDLWSLEAEKYRVGVTHEFLSLPLEKRALIHHIVEFKQEFSLTRQIYHMLKKQPKTFYLAGIEMNWAVFSMDAYGENGDLVNKVRQVMFNEKLY